VLQLDQLDGHQLRRFTGRYDITGNPRWTDGPLLAESQHRFKGQSAPDVVLFEVHFEQLGERERRKLFVGLTRAQMRVELVMSCPYKTHFKPAPSAELNFVGGDYLIPQALLPASNVKN